MQEQSTQAVILSPTPVRFFVIQQPNRSSAHPHKSQETKKKKKTLDLQQHLAVDCECSTLRFGWQSSTVMFDVKEKQTTKIGKDSPTAYILNIPKTYAV